MVEQLLSNQVKKVIYIPGSRYDNETIERLGAYGTTVETTNLVFKRSLVNVELQVSKYDDAVDDEGSFTKGMDIKERCKPFYCMDRLY